MDGRERSGSDVQVMSLSHRDQSTALRVTSELSGVGRSGILLLSCGAVAEISTAIRRCRNRKMRDESFAQK